MPARQRPCRMARFTLAELLVAMAIFVGMMLVLLQTLAFIQDNWRRNRSITTVYANGRVALDVIERDLRCAVASTIPDKEIGFYVADPDPAGSTPDLHLCAVIGGEPQTGAISRFSEVSYRHHADPDNPSTVPPFTLARQLVSDNDRFNWDFLGRPGNWFLNDRVNVNLAGFETVIEGVEQFRITFYNIQDDPIMLGQGLNEVPQRVEVYLLLCDPELVTAPEAVRLKTRRSFTKIIYLGDLKTN